MAATEEETLMDGGSLNQQFGDGGPLGGLPRCAAPTAMAAVAREVALLKNRLDRLARDRDPLIDCLREPFAGREAIPPTSFADGIVPFLDWLRLRAIIDSERYFALIDTQVVIGSSWRWSPHDSNEGLANAALLDKFQHWAADFARGVTLDHLQVAQCTWIPALGIAYAHEGKNRVALYRACDVDFIPSLVRCYDYPESARLTRYDMGDRQLAVLDNCWVAPLPGGAVTRALLDAYGVAAQNAWPADLPALDEVVKALNTPEDPKFWDLSTQSPLFVGVNLDLRVLAARLERQRSRAAHAEEPVVTNIASLTDVRGSARFWAGVILFFVVSLVGLGLSWGDAPLSPRQGLAALCLVGVALSAGVMLAPSCPAWRVPRALAQR